MGDKRKSQRKDNSVGDLDEREIAFHEAAHAVMAVYFGFRLKGKVTILSDGRSAGTCGIPAGTYADNPDAYFRAEQEIIVNFAGAEGVKEFRSQNGIKKLSGLGDIYDVEQARVVFRLHIGSQFNAKESEATCFSRLRPLARDFVAFLYNVIIDLTRELLRHKTVSVEQCKELVQNHPELRGKAWHSVGS
jgi:hypothetical protein